MKISISVCGKIYEIIILIDGCLWDINGNYKLKNAILNILGIKYINIVSSRIILIS